MCAPPLRSYLVCDLIAKVCVCLCVDFSHTHRRLGNAQLDILTVAHAVVHFQYWLKISSVQPQKVSSSRFGHMGTTTPAAHTHTHTHFSYICMICGQITRRVLPASVSFISLTQGSWNRWAGQETGTMLTDRNASMRVDVTERFSLRVPGRALHVIMAKPVLRKTTGPRSLLLCRCSGPKTGLPDEAVKRQAATKPFLDFKFHPWGGSFPPPSQKLRYVDICQLFSWK